ncbi:LysR family transcriptional regulator [Jiangella alba]|uniref:DNA-binding transcriptional regulator, LysR family n=1 Tax=Jiangella alba TaxID=561176 RepID=A0A1H5PWY8_9ACTN|nr:LysR family transcriptional regulator [Jiangella alba]SEF18360.1 DNA-binding transcriptional regulator, LysR family [Jiangella alba]
MQFRQLEYFVAVADEHHFARAADKCFVSQPALSAGIAKLEDELGVALINRVHAFEGLTPEGERLVGWARRILAEHDALKAEVSAMQTGVGGTLRLGVGPTTAAAAVTVIRAFCARHPLAHVRLSEHLSAPELQRRLRGFELDAGIGYLSPGDQDGLHVLPLYEERYVLAASPELLPAGATQIGWADAARLPLVLLNERMRVRQAIDDAFAAHGIEIDPQVVAESVASLSAHVHGGQWATIGPHTLLSDDGSSSSGLRTLPLVDPEITITIVLAINAAARDAAAVRAFAATAAALRLRERLGYPRVASLGGGPVSRP